MKERKKKWKKFTALLLSVAMLIPAQAVYAGKGNEVAEWGTGTYAESREAAADGFEIVDGVLKKYTGTATEVVIPNSVTSIGSFAFSWCSGLTSITIPSSVTSIEYDAFLHCSGLTNLSIPPSVTNIGDEAFCGCSGLTSLSISSNVTSIGKAAFSGCSGLTSIKVDEGNQNYDSRNNCNAIIKTEGDGLICGCKNTSMPSGVTSIGERAFSGCNGLTNLSIPSSVTNIGEYAFYDCSGLTSINIPSSVTSIRRGVFSGCSGLTSLSIPSSVTNIDWNAFSDCSGLTSLSIPSNVTSIGRSAFSDCSGLISLSIPSSVASIGDSAFSGCSGLKSIKVDEGNQNYDSRDNCNAIIKTEDNELIYGCKNTVIPDSVTSIGVGAFLYCSGLTSLSIPDSVTSIGLWAFSYCSGLTSLSIPDSVTNIEWRAFSYCSGLTSIKVDEGNPNYDSRNNCNAIIKTECNELIYGCKNTVIPSNVTEIGEYAFEGCSGLTSITIADSVTCIEGGAFVDCSGLTSITIPESVISIEEAKEDLTFDGCSEELTIYGKKGSYAETYAKENDIKFYSIGTVGNSGTESDNTPVAKKVSTTGILYQKSSGEGIIDLVCDETLFAEDAREYNHELAKFAAGMSALVYNEEERIGNVSNVLKALGFSYNSNIDKTLIDKDGDKAPYCLASKTVKLNGEKTNIVLVTVRGTYKEEWIDNFDPGSSLSDSTHKGFQRGCDYVYNALCKYIKDNNLNKGNLKILVTGHSRGAAVANLLGAKLDDYGVSSGNFSVNILNKDIFVYTFATPNTTMLARRDNSKFNNIYNIVNPEDFVTKVLPYAWGFGRYGITYVLPSQSTEHWVYGKQQNHVKYGEYLDKLQKLYTKYCPKDKDGYEPYDLGMVPVSNYVKLVTKTVPSKREYYTKNLLFGYDIGNVEEDSLQELYTYTLGYFKSKNPAYQALSICAIGDASIGMWGSVGMKTVAYFFSHQVWRKDFECAHRSETYLAAMNVLKKEQLQQDRMTLEGIVNCPVNITVKDESGEIVGQIINNEIVQSSENGIIMDVEGDSKTFTLPKEAEYTVELTGNDNGFMDYSLCEVDPDTGEISRTYYSNVPVSDNTTYTQEITEDSQSSSFELKDEENNVIESTEVLNEKEIGQLSVDVTVEGIGSANGLANLSPGDYVSLEAIVDENNEFLGWYDLDGNLISKDEVYSFSIQKNQSFVAKFTDVVVNCTDIQFEKESLEMKIGEENINTATMLPENTTYKWIRYSSSDTSVVEVGDYGLLKAIGEGTATITATSEDGKSSATMRVTVKGSYTYKLNSDKTTITITKCTSSAANITIPSTIDGYKVTGIGDSAFQNITSLKTVSFPSTLKRIGSYAFSGCTSLKTLSLPKALSTVDANAFLNSGITTIKYAGTSANWKNITISAVGNTKFLNATVTGSDGKKFSADKSKWKTSIKKPTVTKVKSFKAKAAKKKLTLSWKKLSGAAGYQIQISTKKNFKGAKKISISKSKKTYTKKKLKAKKKYYIRIRAYKTYKDANKKTKKVYGKWTTINKKTK